MVFENSFIITIVDFSVIKLLLTSHRILLKVIDEVRGFMKLMVVKA